MDITFEQFTSGTLEGTGTYDTLMRVNLLHIQQEYQAGRIKGADYANVYLSLLQGSMQIAMDFTMREKELELKLESENIKLLMDAVAQYGYNDAVIGSDGKVTLGVRSTTDGLLNKQEAVIDKDIKVKTEQILVTQTEKIKLDKETALLGMDDVIKMSADAKDGTYVYQAKYTN